MPLTHRGREILSRVPGGALQSTIGVRLRDRPPRRALRRLRQVRHQLPVAAPPSAATSST